jgi:hypothetical protein
MRIWTLVTIGALALYSANAAAQPTSIGSASSTLRATAAATGVVDKIAYRRCWLRGGKQICRYVRYRNYPYYAYYGQHFGSGSSPTLILGVRH